MALSTEKLQDKIRSDFGSSIRVSARRPGKIFQVDFPAFLTDGDAATIFIEPTKVSGMYIVSDLANTLMRLSYTRDISTIDEQLNELVGRHGFIVSDGTIQCEASDDELMGAIIGLAQVEACAESAIRQPTTRGVSSKEFREMVLHELIDMFGERVQENFRAPNDKDGLYTIDAVLNLSRSVAVVAVPSELEAERAIVNKLSVATQCAQIKGWIAVAKDINTLGRRPRTRLMKAYTTLPELEVESLREKVEEIAA